jgi:putative hemolysin
MDDPLPLLLVLLIFSGIFSGAEIALFSLGPEKIAAFKNGKLTRTQQRRVLRLETLKSNPERLLVTILVGNNVVNVGASALATVMATTLAESSGFGDHQSLILGGVTGVMTLLILIFGEITPKSLAHKHALKFSLIITPFLFFLQWLLMPIVWPLSALVKKFSGNDVLAHGLNENELKAALELSEREGKIKHSEREWTENILKFGEFTVEAIMTPRSKIESLPDSLGAVEAIKKIQTCQHSRLPVFHEDLDQIIGVLTVHGLLEKISEANFENLKVANLPLRKPFKIPHTMRIDRLLGAFQEEKTHMALVYDEHGGLVGLITMEDVIEEIFGEIHDEQDEEDILLRQVGKDQLIASADTELEALEDFFREKCQKIPEKFPWGYEEENKTVGLYLLEKMQKFPEQGDLWKESLDDLNFIFTVKEVEEEKIGEIEFEVTQK